MKRLLIILLISISFNSYASLINISTQNGDSFNAIIVEKANKQLHLVKVSGDGVSVIKTVNVLTGKMDGDKKVSGDAKTPEGLYKVTGFLPHTKLQEMYGDVSKIYGFGAYPLNYPNFLDKLYGKSGGGIWLHGVEDHRQDPATKGCVAFNNDDVKTVGEYLSKGTPVVITTKAMEGGRDKYVRSFDEVKNAVTDYLAAWQNNDFDKFSKAYSKDFKSKDGKSLSTYLSYKKSLMSLYPNRKIGADKFRVFYESPDEAVAEFNQYYSADNLTAFGRKTLYLRNENGRMRIVAEDFEQTKSWDVKPDMIVAAADIRQPEMEKPTPAKPEPVKPVPAKPETVKPEPVKPEPAKEVKQPESKPEEIVIEDNITHTKDRVNEFLVVWKKAWESKDIDSYIALYSDKFKSGRMNLEAWKKDKASKFESAREVHVNIEDIKISVLSAERMEVTFIQKYASDAYSDKGVKTLRLDGSSGEFKIISEDWRAK